MRRVMEKLALACMLAAAGPVSASAQAIPPGEEGELAEIVRPVPGERACFRRAYDANHLAAHPHQQVTSMEFRLTYHRYDPDENYPEGQRNYYFNLLVERRGKSGKLHATGECVFYDGAIACGVECDGGGIGLRRDGKGSLLVDLTVYSSIRMTDGCGDAEEDAVELAAGRDDRLFRLDPVPDSQCPAYADW